MNHKLDFNRHPCFHADVKGRFGRIHLPVARRCNIRCNYCNRKYDCVNESRPGVSSAILSPLQAVHYLEKVLEREPRITVAGIAGPGDPFADAPVTLETMRLVRERFPHMLICVASNGLCLPPYLDHLADIGVSHVTVTVNAVDPEIGRCICSWVRDGRVLYRGIEAAGLLLERQEESIRGLKARGIVVKTNTIVIPGINNGHVPAVASRMAELGVDLLNCMPMYPNRGTPFEDIPEPAEEEMRAIRRTAGEHLPQMLHCTRCRADAVGLLDSDRSAEFRSCLGECSAFPPLETHRPHVAVATHEGLLVNQHLGEAATFQVWSRTGEEFALVDERAAPQPGLGIKRWFELAEILDDCRAVLVSGIGDTPREVLTSAGILPVEMNGFIEMGLELVYGGGDLSRLKAGRRECGKGSACGGDGSGCM